MIAMAIAHEPSVIVLDEPTTALDVTLQRDILALLSGLREQLGASMLFITHDLAIAAEIADRVAVMYAGRIAELGEPQGVFRRPSHPYTSGLLGSRLALAGLLGADEVRTLPGEPPDPRALPPGCPFEPRCGFAEPRCAAQVPPLVRSPTHAGRDACIRAAEIAPELEPGHESGEGEPSAGDEAPAEPTADPAPASDGLAIELASIAKAFSSREHTQVAVDDVSLEVPAGGALALVGESGCGKTTLLRIAVGLEEADSGEVRLGAGGSPQMVFQDAGASLTPWLSVYRLLDERLRSDGVEGDERERRIRETLARVGLRPEVADARPRELSGGQRQRVALARAVIVPPALLACDEPTSALDVSLAATVINLLRRLRRELGVAMLFVTHDLAVARAVADDVAIMDAGRIVERGSADAGASRPAERRGRAGWSRRSRRWSAHGGDRASAHRRRADRDRRPAQARPLAGRLRREGRVRRRRADHPDRAAGAAARPARPDELGRARRSSRPAAASCSAPTTSGATSSRGSSTECGRRGSPPWRWSASER